MAVQPVVASAAPQLSIQSEDKAHPRLVKAIHDMEATEKLLRSAPTDFGGRKDKAADDVHAAILSVKRALYYRLNLDNEALEKAQ